MLLLVCCASGRVRNRKSKGALERQSVRVCACVCNPGLCENVITCVSKRALVYVSKMAPVLSKSGLYLRMPNFKCLQPGLRVCECVCSDSTRQETAQVQRQQWNNFPVRQTITWRTGSTSLCWAKGIVSKLIWSGGLIEKTHTHTKTWSPLANR